MTLDISEVIIDTCKPTVVQREQLVIHMAALLANAYEDGNKIWEEEANAQFYRNLKSVSDSITHLQEQNPSSIERIIQEQNSLKLMKRFDAFVKHTIDQIFKGRLALTFCSIAPNFDFLLPELLGTNWELEDGRYTYTG